MLITLIFCLCLWTNVHSDLLSFLQEWSNSFPSTSPPPQDELCDKDNELANISCMTPSDHEHIWGGNLKYGLARHSNVLLIPQAIVLIAKQELRKALHLPPLPPWTHYNDTEPSEEEIESAPTIEAYFNLKEPGKYKYSLDNEYYFEKNFPPAIEFLDKRAPIIRRFLRCKFENIHPKDTVIDRQTVDRMITEFRVISKISERVYNRLFNFDCPDD